MPALHVMVANSCFDRLRTSGQLGRINTKLYIGQYYRDKSIDNGIGIGQCTRKCPQYVPGCPLYSTRYSQISRR